MLVESKVAAPSSSTSDLNELTPIQKERFNAIYHIYGDFAAVIVKEVNGNGLRSWKTFFTNALRVYKARNSEAEYYTALTNTFETGVTYSLDEISRSVNEERADLGLDPFIKRINAQCEDDFLKVFFVEVVYDPTRKGKVIGYKPLIPVQRQYS
jgi:hypothetical protein